MTTIAWDGHILAADTLACGRSFDRKVDKIFHIMPGVYFAGCGDLEDCIAAAEWLKDQSKSKPDLEDSFAGILIEHENAYRLEAKLMKSPIKEKHHSVGSGASHAIVAMYLGLGAIDSVKIASLFDANTSNEVTHITVIKLAVV